MVLLPDTIDHTLAAADAALAAQQERRPRAYLGMSAIGDQCARKLWYEFRWAAQKDFDSATLKRFADGHATEALAVARLKAVDQLELHDVAADGRQFGFTDLGGHFRGHMDGVVLGLLQAPKTWHVLEIKACGEDKLKELEKAKADLGEKLALAKWTPTYYAQAVLYMHYAGLDRHYLVACSPGGRKWTSVRTEADPAEAQVLMAKAQKIVHSERPPDRIAGADFYICRWCDFHDLCHDGKPALRNCRTCLSVTPEPDGCWSCARWDLADIALDQQKSGCDRHLYVPDLVSGEQIDAGDDWVKYRLKDGSEWVDKGDQSRSSVRIGENIEHESCKFCGVVTFEVLPGKGPHEAGLRCTGCDRHSGWLPKGSLAA